MIVNVHFQEPEEHRQRKAWRQASWTSSQTRSGPLQFLFGGVRDSSSKIIGLKTHFEHPLTTSLPSFVCLGFKQSFGFLEAWLTDVSRTASVQLSCKVQLPPWSLLENSPSCHSATASTGGAINVALLDLSHGYSLFSILSYVRTRTTLRALPCGLSPSWESTLPWDSTQPLWVRIQDAWMPAARKA